MAIRKEKNGTWTAVVYLNGRQCWRRGFRTKTEAKKYEAKLKLDENPASNLTVDEIAQKFLQYQKKTATKSTVKTNESRYYTHISPHIGKRKAESIKPADVYELIDKMKSSDIGYSESYINHIVGMVSKLYNYGIDMEYVKHNPARRVKKLKEISTSEVKYIKREEIDRLLSVCNDARYKAFLTVLYYTGIRVGEARALNYGQWDRFENSLIINAHCVDKGGFRREMGRKNNKDYKVYLPNNVKATLEELYEIDKKKDGFSLESYIFGFYQPWSYNKIQRTFKKLLEDAGLPDYKLHSLRHGFASMLANNDASVQELASALGDTLEVTFRTYAHMYSDANKKVMQRVNKIIEKE